MASLPALPMLVGDNVLIRAATMADVGGLYAVFVDPVVAKWWQINSEEDVADLINEERQNGWVMEADGRIIGWIQAHESDRSGYPFASLDAAASSKWHGSGLPLEALRLARDWLTTKGGFHRLVADPAADNLRAQSAYVKLGFRRVGVLHEYERSPDGGFRDGVLMEYIVSHDADRALNDE